MVDRIHCSRPRPRVLVLGKDTQFEKVEFVPPLCCPEHLMDYKLHCLQHEWKMICNLDEKVFDNRFRDTNIQPSPVKFLYVLDDFRNDVVLDWIDRQSLYLDEGLIKDELTDNQWELLENSSDED